MSSSTGSGYLAKLGNLRFELKKNEFQILNRDTTWRWVSVDVLNKAPRLHFAGKGEDKIQFEGVLRPSEATGYSILENIRKQANKGDPLAFTYANERAGQYLGKWVILNLTEKRSYFNTDGTPKKIDFTLEIQHYPED